MRGGADESKRKGEVGGHVSSRWGIATAPLVGYTLYSSIAAWLCFPPPCIAAGGSQQPGAVPLLCPVCAGALHAGDQRLPVRCRGGGGRGGALAAGQAAIPHSAEPLAPRDVVGVLLSCAKRCPRAACCSDMIKSVDLRQPHQWFPMARALQRR